MKRRQLARRGAAEPEKDLSELTHDVLRHPWMAGLGLGVLLFAVLLVTGVAWSVAVGIGVGDAAHGCDQGVRPNRTTRPPLHAAAALWRFPTKDYGDTPDRRGRKNVLASLLAVAITALGIVGESGTGDPLVGRVGMVLALVVLFRWGYWRQRR
jgi:hypothetical protein